MCRQSYFCLLVGAECKGHPIFQRRVWYRATSLRYACIHSVTHSPSLFDAPGTELRNYLQCRTRSSATAEIARDVDVEKLKSIILSPVYSLRPLNSHLYALLIAFNSSRSLHIHIPHLSSRWNWQKTMLANCFSFWGQSPSNPLPGLRSWTPLGDFCPNTPKWKLLASPVLGTCTLVDIGASQLIFNQGH